MIEWVVALLVPIGGWAWYVEQRLTEMKAISAKLDLMDAKVERLVTHLLERQNDSENQARR